MVSTAMLDIAALQSLASRAATASPSSLLARAFRAACRTSLALAAACSSRYSEAARVDSGDRQPRHPMATIFTPLEPLSRACLTSGTRSLRDRAGA